MDALSSEEQDHIDQFRFFVLDGFAPIGELRAMFDTQIRLVIPTIETARVNYLWGQVMQRPKAQLLALKSVSRFAGNGQISLYE